MNTWNSGSPGTASRNRDPAWGPEHRALKTVTGLEGQIKIGRCDELAGDAPEARQASREDLEVCVWRTRQRAVALAQWWRPWIRVERSTLLSLDIRKNIGLTPGSSPPPRRGLGNLGPRGTNIGPVRSAGTCTVWGRQGQTMA